MSLYVRGYPYYSEFDYDDFYDAIYDYYNDIDRIYDWLQSPHPRRGDIKIELTSPHGTTSVLLPYRNYDFVNEEGYDDWPFMSVHFWGENPVGTWTLKITYKSGSGYVTMSGLSMTLYGTATVPTAVTFNTPGMSAQTEQGHGNVTYNYAESDDKTNVLPVVIGVPAAVVVLAIAIVVSGGIVIVVYKKKRRARSARFIRMTANEEET